MKKLLLVTLAVLLTGCFGPAEFDASNEVTIQESSQKIIDGLPKEQREEFKEAITYLTVGGENGFVSMVGAIFSGKSPEVFAETMLLENLQSIDGLTGKQIIKKYRTTLAQDRNREEKEKAERKKISDLEKEAQEFLKSNKFEEALSKYKAMGEITSGIEVAEAGIESTTKAMEEFTEKMNYIDKVEITEFLAKRIDTYSKKGIPAVRISLKNVGDKSLDEVKVVVYFQDKNGQTIFEEDYHPVLVSTYSFRGDNKPLKPGYVKEMEKDKYYTLDSALSEWQEGKAVAKIVDLKFTE